MKNKGFQYLVCLDFQLNNSKPSNPSHPNGEIIEFSWLVFDTSDGEIVEDFERFVKPQWNSEIDAKTTLETGVTQELLDSSDSLAAIVKGLDHYLYINFISENKTFCFLCFGQDTMKSCLHKECQEKEINLQAHFGKYFDIKNECRKFGVNVGTGNDLAELASAVGVSTTGKRSHGIEACRTLASIATTLVRQGHTFVTPIVIQDSEDPITPSCSPSSSTENEASEYIRLRGLPWEATLEDIESFFSGLSIAQNGIYMPLNFQGRPIGEAYVKFSSIQDATSAQQKHKSNMGRRYIEVYPANAKLVEAAKIRYNSYGDYNTAIDETGIIRLRGLPFSATIDDIIYFFHGLNLHPDDVTMVFNREGRASGEAYVEFPNAQIGKEAMKRHGEKLGNRYVELFRSSLKDLNIARDRARRRNPMCAINNDNLLNAEVCLRMRGLPFSCSVHDIECFFANYGRIVVDGIHIVYNSDDKPSGEAYVEFLTTDDCKAAMLKNRSNIGHRYVELFLVTKADMLHALGIDIRNSFNRNGDVVGIYSPENGMGGVGMQDMGCVGMRVPSYQMGNNVLGMNPGFQYHSSHPPGNFSQAAATVQNYAQPLAYIPPSNYAPPVNGCLVKMRGLPFRTTVPEIVEFFRGYTFNPDSIRIGIGRDGRPSGEAWIVMSHPGEASRAVANLNRRNIGNRWVELFVDFEVGGGGW